MKPLDFSQQYKQTDINSCPKTRKNIQRETRVL